MKNVFRHPQIAAVQARGVVAITAPKLPMDIRRPIMVVNSFFLNHREMALTAGTYTPPTPSPMSARPTEAQPMSGDMPKRKQPAAAAMDQ